MHAQEIAHEFLVFDDQDGRCHSAAPPLDFLCPDSIGTAEVRQGTRASLTRSAYRDLDYKRRDLATSGGRNE
jgi:hypothetical protein